MSEIEERLFLALDAIEKLVEQTEKQQLIVDAQQKTIAEQQQDIVKTSCDKINSINLSQSDFNTLVTNATYKAVSDAILTNVKTDAKKAVYQVTRDVASNFNDAVKKSTELINTSLLNKSTNDVDVDKIMKSNIIKASNLSDAIAKQQTQVATKHYFLVTAFTAAIFLFSCFVFFIVYITVMPTSGEIESLKRTKAALVEDNRDLLHRKNKLDEYIRNNKN